MEILIHLHIFIQIPLKAVTFYLYDLIFRTDSRVRFYLILSKSNVSVLTELCTKYRKEKMLNIHFLTLTKLYTKTNCYERGKHKRQISEILQNNAYSEKAF